MRMVELIEKKKNKNNLSKEEIAFIISEYVKGRIPDYQMSALLMAIYFNGMNNDEIFYLTNEMLTYLELRVSSVINIQLEELVIKQV